jgi:hypothetical protein
VQLQQALLEIADIRERMAGAQVFRGYRALVAAVSGVFAFAAAALQSRLVGDPVARLDDYVRWWSVVAAVSVGLTGLDLAIRWLRDDTERERVRIWNAVRALIPCLLTGAALSAIVVRFRPEAGPLLPALWALLFAQGLYASVPLLPRGIAWVATYYVAAALAVITWGTGSEALDPWTMAVPFGIGQLLAAAVLYGGRERHAA